MKAMHWDAQLIDFMAWLFDDIRRGYTANITNDVQELLQRPPRSLGQYLRDYTHVWQC